MKSRSKTPPFFYRFPKKADDLTKKVNYSTFEISDGNNNNYYQKNNKNKENLNEEESTILALKLENKELIKNIRKINLDFQNQKNENLELIKKLKKQENFYKKINFELKTQYEEEFNSVKQRLESFIEENSKLKENIFLLKEKINEGNNKNNSKLKEKKSIK